MRAPRIFTKLSRSADGRYSDRAAGVARHSGRAMSIATHLTESEAPIVEAAPSPRASFSLLRWFSLSSLVIITVGGVAMALLLGQFIARHMLMRDAEVSRDFIESIARTEDSYMSFSAGASDAQARDALNRFVLHIPSLPGVVNANLYSVDGVVLWSSETSLIGRRFTNNDELDEALAGQIVSSTGVFNPNDKKAEHTWIRDRAEDGQDNRFVEAYLPIRDSARQHVIAVVEIYKLPRSLFRSIDRGVQLVWISAGLFGIALYAALFWLIRKADALLRDQQDRLVASESLSAVGEMSASVAHSIRNPLASIRSAAEIAQEEDGPQLAASLRDITNQADRIDGWIRDMLAACRGGTIPREAVDVRALLDEVLGGMAHDMQMRAIVVENHLEDLPIVIGSRTSLLHAFRNIVANAVDAMPRGGRLTLTGGRVGGSVRVDIHDTGPGMNAASTRKAFRPFFTTKPNGTGLGLSLSRRIVERHAGEVRIQSRPGRGTRVTVILALER